LLDTDLLQTTFLEFTNRCIIFQRTCIPQYLVVLKHGFTRFKNTFFIISKRNLWLFGTILKPIIGTVEWPTSCTSGPLHSTRPRIYEYAPVRIHLRSIRRHEVYYYKYIRTLQTMGLISYIDVGAAIPLEFGTQWPKRITISFPKIKYITYVLKTLVWSKTFLQ